MFRPGNYVINQEEKRQRENLFSTKMRRQILCEEFFVSSFYFVAELVAKRNLVCGCTDDGFYITGAVFILS